MSVGLVHSAHSGAFSALLVFGIVVLLSSVSVALEHVPCQLLQWLSVPRLQNAENESKDIEHVEIVETKDMNLTRRFSMRT